jgi:uncharacterized membrane protein
MDWINLIIGILLIVLGILLISLYQDLKKENKTGTFSFKIQTGGIGLIMIGITLIIRELF